jgi:hypothetical protein
MTSIGFIVEDILYGESNFLSWKTRDTLVLEYDLWELVEKVVVPLTYLITLEVHEKKEIKVERAILDLVEDHLIPHLSEKNLAKDTFYGLVGLFQSTNIHKKMVLRNKFILVQMFRYENVTIYLIMITHKLVAIWEKTKDTELMNVALNGLPKSWELFFK